VATELGPDLEFGREQVELLMDDTCQVFPVEWVETWEKDPETLQLIPPTVAVPLYDGPCKVAETATTTRAAPGMAEGAIPMQITSPRVDFPINDVRTVLFRAGMFVLMTSSRRNPRLPGEVFVMREFPSKSLAVKMAVVCDRRTRLDV
jgi:hypothetical protein